MTAQEREQRVFEHQKLTVMNDSGHYELYPQRGCFERCERCFNLSEADSFEKDGIWYPKEECRYCIQRAIDLLGFYEHGKVPDLLQMPTPKNRRSEGGNPLLEALERGADNLAKYGDTSSDE